MENKKKLTKIGALWSKKTQDGVPYLSGVIKIQDHDYKLRVFVNNRKTNDRQPDWSITTDEETGNTPYQKTEGSVQPVSENPEDFFS